MCSKPQPPPANRADTEGGAMAEARKLASKAAIAAAAEAAQTAPMVEVTSLHFQGFIG